MPDTNYRALPEGLTRLLKAWRIAVIGVCNELVDDPRDSAECDAALAKEEAAKAELDAALQSLVADSERLDWLAAKVLKVVSADETEWDVTMFHDAEHPDDDSTITGGPRLRDAIDQARAARSPAPSLP